MSGGDYLSKKKADLEVFYSLTRKQQKAITMLFEGKHKQKKIALEISVADSTITKWKKNEKFRKAQDEYNHFMLREYSSAAVQTMHNLLEAKSEMVRFNAAKDILDRTGIISETDLQLAQIDKLKAETEELRGSNKGNEDANNWSELVAEAEKELSDHNE